MKIKDIKRFFKLKKELKRRMVEVEETMALDNASETYAKYVCAMYNWTGYYGSNPSPHLWAIQFAFMNGYSKAMHDNGYEFKNGLVKKRHILEDMPSGACEYYRKDAIKETKFKAVGTLRAVLSKYETSKENVNVIVTEFKRELEKEELNEAYGLAKDFSTNL